MFSPVIAIVMSMIQKSYYLVYFLARAACQLPPLPAYRLSYTFNLKLMYWHLLLVIVILMARFVCPGHGCGREFGSNKSLSAHKRSCKLKLAATAKISLHRQWEKESERQQDLEQSGGEAMEAVEAEQFELLVEEPEASIHLFAS
jgi:hypothetical protein